MITLYQYPRALGLPNPSPFCMKVEAFLRLAHLPYQTKVALPLRAPLGKLPYIIDGTARIADSSSIIEHLTRTQRVALDAALGPAQRAQGHALARMLEEHTYWAIVHSRWFDARNWPTVRDVFFGPLPPGIGRLAAALVRRKLRRDYIGHGLGRHPTDELFRRAAQDLDALAQHLGDKPFLFGAAPTSFDAVAYAFVGNAWHATLDSPLKQVIAGHPNLAAHADRMRAQCFPEGVPAR